jgi:hypothetical protein
MNISFITESEDLGYENDLARFFVEAGIVSESKMAMWLDTASVLTENVAKQRNPSTYNFSMYGFSVVINWDLFWDVYNNIAVNDTNAKVLNKLAIPEEMYDERKDSSTLTSDQKSNVRKEVQKMATHFKATYGGIKYIPTSAAERITLLKEKLNFKQLDDVPVFKNPHTGMIELDKAAIAEMQMPKETGTSLISDIDSLEFNSPDQNNIHRGKIGEDRTRGGIIAKKVNDLQIFNGILYTNISKIPKQSLFNWLKLWKKDMVGLSPEKIRMFGRSWNRVFVLGYQVNEKFFYEVWFNTIDSTFSVHDSRGAQMGRRSPTMFEAIKQLFQQLAKVGLSDGEFIRGGVDKSMIDSLARALDGNLDQLTQDMLGREQKEKKAKDEKHAEAVKEYEEKQQKRKKLRDKIISGMKKAIAVDGASGANTVAGAAMAGSSKLASAGFSAASASLDATQAYVKDKKEQIKKEREAIAQREKEREERVRQVADNYGYKFVPISKVNKADMSGNIYDMEDGTWQQPASNVTIRKVNEAFGDEKNPIFDEASDLNTVIQQQTDTAQYLQNVERLRNDTRKDSANYNMIRDTIMGSIEKYEETRMPSSMINKVSKQSVFNRVKMRLAGTMFKADFIVGFTVNNRINLEVWYVTEPNPEYVQGSPMGKTISSFYLYDVTSEKLIRKWIPYYRNAEQLILQKIGVFDLPQQRKQVQAVDQTGRPVNQQVANRQNAQRFV